MVREQEAGKSNATQMEKDTRLQLCVEVKHYRSASETAIDSEDEYNGSIADELRANPNVLKTSRKLSVHRHHPVAAVAQPLSHGEIISRTDASSHSLLSETLHSAVDRTLFSIAHPRDASPAISESPIGPVRASRTSVRRPQQTRTSSSATCRCRRRAGQQCRRCSHWKHGLVEHLACALDSRPCLPPPMLGR